MRKGQISQRYPNRPGFFDAVGQFDHRFVKMYLLFSVTCRVVSVGTRVAKGSMEVLRELSIDAVPPPINRPRDSHESDPRTLERSIDVFTWSRFSTVVD